MLNPINMTNVLNGTLEFIVQDRKDRPTGELLKTVKFTPLNATGQYVPLLADTPREERRAALNAITRFVLRMDEKVGPLHKYADVNPSRLAGAIGWLDLSQANVPEKGSIHVTSPWNLWDGRTSMVTLPNRKVFVTDQEYDDLRNGGTVDVHDRPLLNGKLVSVVWIEGNWVTVKDLAGDLNLKNGPIDPLHGKSNGALLHKYIDALFNGAAFTIVVAMTTDPNTGQPKDTYGLQTNANWMKRTFSIEGFDLQKAQAAYIAGKKQQAMTFGFLNKTANQEGADSEEEFNTAKTILDSRINGGAETGVTVNLIQNGKIVKVDGKDVPAGVYSVVRVVSGKESGIDTPSLSIAKTTGARIIQRISRRNDLALKFLGAFS